MCFVGFSEGIEKGMDDGRGGGKRSEKETTIGNRIDLTNTQDSL